MDLVGASCSHELANHIAEKEKPPLISTGANLSGGEGEERGRRPYEAHETVQSCRWHAEQMSSQYLQALVRNCRPILTPAQLCNQRIGNVRTKVPGDASPLTLTPRQLIADLVNQVNGLIRYLKHMSYGVSNQISQTYELWCLKCLSLSIGNVRTKVPGDASPLTLTPRQLIADLVNQVNGLIRYLKHMSYGVSNQISQTYELWCLKCLSLSSAMVRECVPNRPKLIC